MKFEYILEVPPTLTTETQLVEFTTSILNQFQNENHTVGESATITLGDYTNLSWLPNSGFTDKDDIESFGIKMLPGAGGFYYAKLTDKTTILEHIAETTQTIP